MQTRYDLERLNDGGIGNAERMDQGEWFHLATSSLKKLETYIRAEQYRGHDPYDALQSPFFRLPYLRSNRLVRLSAQQLVKNFPVSLRWILRIPKGYNPVTLGLCLQAYCDTQSVFLERKDEIRERMEYCFSELEQLKSRGYHGACWGYDFDWEARYGRMNAGTPTVVATGIITNALFQAFQITGESKYLDACKSACEFVRRDLRRSMAGGTFCYSYSPSDNQRVFNATMKGARILAQVYSVGKDESLMPDITGTVRFVLDHQRSDGSWPYADGDTRTWRDNFHTGYILDCLKEIARCTGIDAWRREMEKGFEYYRLNFFSDEVIPKYYDHSPYPVDATAVAQSIMTLARFGDIGRAQGVARWAMTNMQKPEGYFIYRIHRFYREETSFMRWSNAWMFAALAYVTRRSVDLV